ncbi:hypothetical protein OE749_11580 [Aestuariibacter sp. AA17]|uniref:Uncharacterized protein n=1 Tax=Fluctibacter corallii TaxID=2984329 RepID=A0ABT3A9K8_9ALTE|nr:hypothetical protein [Aestuariibacter sp. AA17]MCV2885334.1 hypothetical protein [Aestuariibacter sp. AA17]
MIETIISDTSVRSGILYYTLIALSLTVLGFIAVKVKTIPNTKKKRYMPLAVLGSVFPISFLVISVIHLITLASYVGLKPSELETVKGRYYLLERVKSGTHLLVGKRHIFVKNKTPFCKDISLYSKVGVAEGDMLSVELITKTRLGITFQCILKITKYE